MNIFILDASPVASAIYHMDTHVVNAPKESIRMLLIPHYLYLSRISKISIHDIPIDILTQKFKEDNSYIMFSPETYTSYQLNNPCSSWVRKSYHNWLWLLMQTLELSKEYTHRFNKPHPNKQTLRWLYTNTPIEFFSENQLTDFPLMLPKEFHTSSPIKSYREYYIRKKSHLAKWTNRTRPEWYLINQQKEEQCHN